MPIINRFSEREESMLRKLAGSMIAASQAKGLPGADEDGIFANILARAARENYVSEGLAECFAESGGIEKILSLSESEFQSSLDKVRQKNPAFLAAFMVMVVQIYYQDEEVLSILGREGSPPYPRGNTLEQGDWSLLDPVKRRSPFYREC